MSLLDIFKVNQYKASISRLQEDNATLHSKLHEDEKAFENYKIKVSELNETISDLTNKINELEGYIHSNFPLFDTARIPLSNTIEENKKFWAYCWSYIDHDEEQQLARQYRACEPRLTPLHIAPDKATGTFRGYYSDYETSLKKCDCMDFQHRLMPCKHIYRLASELEIFTLPTEVEYVKEPNKIMHRNTFCYLCENLTVSAKEILQMLCSCDVVVANRSNAEPLISNGFVVISTNKIALLDNYKRSELYALLPENTDIKKNTKKSDLIPIILEKYPHIVTDLEKLYVPLELSENIMHLKRCILSL